MDFILSDDAREWFSEIKGEFASLTSGPSAPDFDVFYFCFIAGIVSGQKAELPTGDARIAIVENFPGPYKSRSSLLVSVFLSRELEYLGVTMDEREVVREQVSHWISAQSPNLLTDEGVHEISKYAAGGIGALKESLVDKPRSLSVFLQAFKKFVDESVSGSDE